MGIGSAEEEAAKAVKRKAATQAKANLTCKAEKSTLGDLSALAAFKEEMEAPKKQKCKEEESKF